MLLISRLNRHFDSNGAGLRFVRWILPVVSINRVIRAEGGGLWVVVGSCPVVLCGRSRGCRACSDVGNLRQLLSAASGTDCVELIPSLRSHL